MYYIPIPGKRKEGIGYFHKTNCEFCVKYKKLPLPFPKDPAILQYNTREKGGDTMNDLNIFFVGGDVDDLAFMDQSWSVSER